jgi:Flp pilus assembly protein TadD
VAPTNLSIAIAKSAKLLDLRGDSDKAASILKEGLDSAEATDHPDEVLEALVFLSEIQLSQGDRISAIMSAKRALQMEACVGNTDRYSPHLRTARRVLASCRGKLSEMKETKK